MVYKNENVIMQWVEVINLGQRMIKVNRLNSAFWMSLSGNHSHIEWYDSCHAQEAPRPEKEKLTKGLKVIKSRGGNRHIGGAAPMFAMAMGGAVDENKTPCLIAALAWSGSLNSSFDLDQKNSLVASMRMDFSQGSVELNSG